jgi:NitT/TauT family transport system substrate-binding protein
MSLCSLKTAAAATAFAVASLAAVATHAEDKVSLQMAWRAQADYGGYYQAVATGIYKKYGIDADVKVGGPQIDGAQLLVAGRVDFLTASSFAGLYYAKEKLPFLVVAAPFQKDPQILMVHPDAGYKTMEDLKGHPIIISASARTSFWPFLRARFGYTDDQIRPFTFNYAPFLANKESAQQGYINADILSIRKSGMDPKWFLLADYGFDNYANTINTSRKLVETNPDLVQRFVSASMEGWASYLHGDPKPAWALIKQANTDMTDEEINYNYTTIKERGLLDGGDAKELGIGAMTDARWEKFVKTNIDTGNMPADIDWKKAYTLQFVNKKVGLEMKK